MRFDSSSKSPDPFNVISSASTQSSNSSGSGVRVGTVVGAVVGSLSVLVMALLLTLLIRRSRRRKQWIPRHDSLPDVGVEHEWEGGNPVDPFVALPSAQGSGRARTKIPGPAEPPSAASASTNNSSSSASRQLGKGEQSAHWSPYQLQRGDQDFHQTGPGSDASRQFGSDQETIALHPMYSPIHRMPEDRDDPPPAY